MAIKNDGGNPFKDAGFWMINFIFAIPFIFAAYSWLAYGEIR